MECVLVAFFLLFSSVVFGLFSCTVFRCNTVYGV